MEKFVENINNTIVDLTFNENFEVESADMNSPETIAIDFIKENDLNEIYTNFNGVEFQWTHLKHQLFGSLKIQSATNFFEDSWEFMVDEVEECSGCDLETFRVFDFYANQN